MGQAPGNMENISEPEPEGQSKITVWYWAPTGPAFCCASTEASISLWHMALSFVE
jgi:hypothetical protein